jgi:hypothetical protein
MNIATAVSAITGRSPAAAVAPNLPARGYRSAGDPTSDQASLPPDPQGVVSAARWYAGGALGGFILAVAVGYHIVTKD